MTVKVYRSTQQFWDEISPHLRKQEVKNNLCLGLSQLYAKDPKGCLYQSALLSENELLGAMVVATYMSHRNLLVSPVKNEVAAELLLSEFQKANISVTGLVGDATTADRYAALFTRVGRTVKVNMRQAIYRCSVVVMPPMTDGLTFRRAVDADISRLAPWIEAFNREAVPHDGPVDGKQVASARIASRMIYLLEEGGELLSSATWSRDLGTSCAINFVYTPKDKRGHGYGSLVTACLTQELLNQGKQEICLYTDLSNVTTNKIYQAIGYEHVCDSRHYGVT